jgi:peptide-methionine (S)-S-oxide reductase
MKQVFLLFLILLNGFGGYSSTEHNVKLNAMIKEKPLGTATLAGGCFWCLEAIFSQVKGVDKVISGYAGGTTKNPTYEEVCTGNTGHAEVVQIHYDPAVITYKEILMLFFAMHDPTTVNRQGNDIGSQYRSAIFYNDAKQKTIAQEVIKELDAQKIFDHKIVTKLEPLKEFYYAEDYHQHYFAKNPTQGYCHTVINPKVVKFRKQFTNYLKD